MRTRAPLRPLRGFTLVELLVAMTVLGLMVALLAVVLNNTNRLWKYNQGRVEQFRAARLAFDSLTQRLGQATLNTYLDYIGTATGSTGETFRTADNWATFRPTRYVRQSELRFICGMGVAGSADSAPPRPTSSVFFQAPLGSVDDSANGNLSNLLNTCGYYIEYGDDPSPRPPFVPHTVRNRFRLMEMVEPSDQLSVYQYTSGDPNYQGWDWFLGSINAQHVRVLAENVVALILVPKLAPADQQAGGYTDASLAPTYLYDSTGKDMTTLADPGLNPKNQLPPVVQATLVAIDEESAMRMGDQGQEALLQKLGSLFTDASQFSQDLLLPPAGGSGSLEQYLIDNKINMRVFTTSIGIKSAKWSSGQKN